MAKISTPDTSLSTVTILNGRSTLANDPRTVDKMNDRLGTGCRRLAIPATMGRGREPDYDTTIWELTVTVPPWTKAIGLRARGVIEVDDDDPDAAALLYYRYSGDAWEHYIAFAQSTHGSVDGVDYQDVIHLDWVGTIDGANPDAVISAPLPVTVDDEPQELTVEFKIECDPDFRLYEYGLYVVPYDMEPFADLP